MSDLARERRGGAGGLYVCEDERGDGCDGARVEKRHFDVFVAQTVGDRRVGVSELIHHHNQQIRDRAEAQDAAPPQVVHFGQTCHGDGQRTAECDPKAPVDECCGRGVEQPIEGRHQQLPDDEQEAGADSDAFDADRQIDGVAEARVRAFGQQKPRRAVVAQPLRRQRQQIEAERRPARAHEEHDNADEQPQFADGRGHAKDADADDGVGQIQGAVPHRRVRSRRLHAVCVAEIVVQTRITAAATAVTGPIAAAGVRWRSADASQMHGVGAQQRLRAAAVGVARRWRR